MFKGDKDYRTLRLRRAVKPGVYPFSDIFRGLETTSAVKGIFGAKTGSVMGALKVRVLRHRWGYLWIDDHNGRVNLNINYLRKGAKRDLYLDAVHELMHMRQLGQGRNLWGKRNDYVNWPTEIEAYRYAVVEARRLGMSERQIANYLYMEWLDGDSFEQLCKNVGVKPQR